MGAYATTKEGRNDDWCTPPEVVAVLQEYGTIVLDPCSNAESMVPARRALYKKHDGLATPWVPIMHEERVRASCPRPFTYVNPPYSNTVGWVAKIQQEYDRGVETILLMPARTETALFHEEIARTSSAVSFHKKRIHFYRGGRRSTRPDHPSMFCAWLRPENVEHFIEVFDRYGTTYLRANAVPF